MSEMAEQMLKTGIKIEVYETSRTGGNLIQIDQNQLSQWIDNDQDCHAQVHVYPDRHRQQLPVLEDRLLMPRPIWFIN